MENQKSSLGGFAALALEKAREVAVKDGKIQPNEECAFSIDSERASNLGRKVDQAPTRHSVFF